MTTGERIKQARTRAGMTQKELAEKIGVKFSAIHKYESGMVVNLKRETIAALASALDVSPAWLMCMDDETINAPLYQLAEKKVQEEHVLELVNGDPELTDLLERVRDDPHMRMLFSVTKDATAEDLEKAIKIIQTLKGE